MTSASVAPYLRLSEWSRLRRSSSSLQARGVNVDLVRVMRELRLQFAQRGDGLLVQRAAAARAERPPAAIPATCGRCCRPGSSSEVSFSLNKPSAAWLSWSSRGGVAGPAMVLLDLRLFSGLEAARRQSRGLEAQQVELLRVGLLVHDQRGLFGFQRGAAADQLGEGLALGVKPPKASRMASCRAGCSSDWCSCGPWMSTSHSPSAARMLQGRGRAVDELAVGAGAGEGAFEDELVVLARLQAVLLQE